MGLTTLFVGTAFLFGLAALPLPAVAQDDGIQLPPKCDFVQMEDFSKLTHRNILFQKSVSKDTNTAPFDDDLSDFDIFLRFMADTNLTRDLSEFARTGANSTLFAARDYAMIQTAIDMRTIMEADLASTSASDDGEHTPVVTDVINEPTERQAYNIIHRFTRRYKAPTLVLLDIFRNHVSPTTIALCEYIYAGSWKTWSNRNVSRRGMILLPNDRSNLFPPSNLFLNPLFPQIITSQGIVQNIDRLIMPDLSNHELLPSPSPSPSQTPTASPSFTPGFSFEPTVTPSVSVSASVQLPSPSPSQHPSAPPIPSISQPLVPFATPGDDTSLTGPSPTTTSGTSPDESSNNASDNACFPGDASVYLSATKSIAARHLDIGHQVLTLGSIPNVTSASSKDQFKTTATTSRVFMFSHRMETAPRLFVLLRTRDFQLPISDGHFLPLNGAQLRPAAEARVGDTVMTVSGPQAILHVGSVWATGLYAPHTVEGSVVVNGIVTSCYTTAVKAHVAHTALTPLRAVARIWVWRKKVDVIQGWMDNGVHPSVVRMMQRLMPTISTSNR